MSAAEQQAYLEELEGEYRQLQLDLSDTLLLNGQLASKIDITEQELIEKEVKCYIRLNYDLSPVKIFLSFRYP